MKKIRVEDAVGMTLCHDITAMRDGFKGAAFKRGHVITEEDVPELLKIGKQRVYIWEEHAGEIHEEDAARRMAAMTPVAGAHYTEPSEGKVLLMADTRGMFRVNRDLLEKVNKIGDIVMPMPKNNKWSGFFSSFDMFSDDFMENGREQPKE